MLNGRREEYVTRDPCRGPLPTRIHGGAAVCLRRSRRSTLFSKPLHHHHPCTTTTSSIAPGEETAPPPGLPDHDVEVASQIGHSSSTQPEHVETCPHLYRMLLSKVRHTLHTCRPASASAASVILRSGTLRSACAAAAARRAAERTSGGKKNFKKTQSCLWLVCFRKKDRTADVTALERHIRTSARWYKSSSSSGLQTHLSGGAPRRRRGCDGIGTNE